jgi:hypothetical protein
MDSRGEIYEEEENSIELMSDDEDDTDDEDYYHNDEFNFNLFQSNLHFLDEVLFCRDIFHKMQQQTPQDYQKYFFEYLNQE